MVDLEAPGALLLIHDGELADVRRLLDEFGLGFREISARSGDPGAYLAAGLVIATPQYLVDRVGAGDGSDAVRVAIMEGESRTLRSMLSRGGVDWIVRRPVHPAALRLLLLHCLYNGPEKRKGTRVGMGVEVRVQSGWRGRKAILVEISERDCRLLSMHPVEVGARLKVRLPAEVAGRRALSLEGRVVRTAPSDDAKRPAEIGLIFEKTPEKDVERLHEMVVAHSQGPAMLRGKPANEIGTDSGTAVESHAHRRSVISVADIRGPQTKEPTSETRGAEDRRRDSRHEFERKVIALGEEATRVLLGRDISLRGMRVDPTDKLEVGLELQIAIHVPGQESPLVLDARVDRDDGDQGLVLHFLNLSKTASGYLSDILSELQCLSPGGDDDGGASARVVTQVIGRLGG